MAVSGVISSCETSARSCRSCAVRRAQGFRARLEVLRHAVEGPRQRADLVAAAFYSTDLRLTLAERRGRPLERPQPVVRRPEDHEGQ